MPQLLRRMDLRNTIATWDALNTQKETVKTVINGKGDYVGALKGNQHFQGINGPAAKTMERQKQTQVNTRSPKTDEAITYLPGGCFDTKHGKVQLGCMIFVFGSTFIISAC